MEKAPKPEGAVKPQGAAKPKPEGGAPKGPKPGDKK
jgi:hypothetical protein